MVYRQKATQLSLESFGSGFEAEIQQNGTHILDMVRKEKYDALILDIMLPGKSGLDICRELRRESSIPILMVTAKKEEVDKHYFTRYSAATMAGKDAWQALFLAICRASLDNPINNTPEVGRSRR